MKRIVAALLVACLAAAPVHAWGAAKKDNSKAAAKTPAVVDSLGLLERSIARDSSQFDVLFRLGGMYLDRDKINEAGRVWLKALQLKPNDVPTLVNLGAAYDAGGRAEEAQAYYRKALELSPGDEIASCRLASSLYSRSFYPEAMDMLRKVLAKKPDAYCAYFTMGVAFADAGIYSEAVRMWKKVVELAPTSPEAVSARESITVLEQYIKGH